MFEAYGKDEKIPVCDGLEDFIGFIEQYPDAAICPYVADKDTEGWDRSTSRVYMNQVLRTFLYVPVNIRKDDVKELESFFQYVSNMNRVVAVNITQPHKSNPVIKKKFLGDSSSNQNVDTLIRNEADMLVPYDLNSVAFMEWYKQEVGSFENKNVILLGVGGVGEPIAKRLAGVKTSRLMLVDPNDKTSLAAQIEANTSYHQALSELTDIDDDLIVINAAGKEGGADPGLNALLRKYTNKSNVFVDIRPQLEITEVKLAKSLGWQGHTGHGMNARNDYELLRGIASYIHQQPIDFVAFQRLVAEAS